MRITRKSVSLLDILLLLLLPVTILSSCATQQIKTPLTCTQDFENVAIPSVLAGTLFETVKGGSKFGFLGGKKSFAVNLFPEETTGLAVKTSRHILTIILQKAKKDYPEFVVTELTKNSAQTADYLIDGFIHHKPLPSPLPSDSVNCNSNSTEKFYSVEANVIERKTGAIVAKSRVWIQNKNAVVTTPIVDSPTLINVSKTEKEITKLVGEVVSTRGMSQLVELAPLLNEADKSFEQGSFDTAAKLFEQASRISSGKEQTRIYSGLYSSLFKLGQKSKAEEVMSKLVAAAASENSLAFHILFETARSDVAGLANPDEYAIWIRQIGKYFNRTKQCLQIVGHTSKTGGRDYDLALSKKRAITIKSLLESYYPEARVKSSPIGMGFDDCKDCAPNDNIAKVDRRVEFKMVDCANIPS